LESRLAVSEIFNGECDAMVDMILIILLFETSAENREKKIVKD